MRGFNAEARGEYLAAFFLAMLSMRTAVEARSYARWRMVKPPSEPFPSKRLNRSIDFLVECEEITPEAAEVFKSAYLKYRSLNKLFRELGPVTNRLVEEVHSFINNPQKDDDTEEEWR